MGAEFLHGGAKDSLLRLVGARFAFTGCGFRYH
jgi:hypothetical protein